MADAPKDPTQVSQAQELILLAKTRAAERIKTLFHQEKEANMKEESAVEQFRQLKTVEKKRFDKEKRLEELKRLVWYLAPRPTLEKKLQQAA
jgi:hypothetical protein